MKTSNKLLLGLFCLIFISLIVINVMLKIAIGNIPAQKEFLKLHSQVIGNSLFIDSTEVILSIDKNTTIVDISNYKTKLKEVNIDLNIDKIEYDTDNKIKSLAIKVDCNDGYVGTANKMLNGDEKIGFYRLYRKDAKSPFAMIPISFENQSVEDSLQTEALINSNLAGLQHNVNPGLVLGKEEVFLMINKNTTSVQLDEYRTKLKVRNIDFKVEKIEFDAENKIKTIEISVDCNDGFLGTIKETLDDNKTIGFYRIYSKNAQSPFGMIPIVEPMKMNLQKK
jgi:hypothetical protein